MKKIIKIDIYQGIQSTLKLLMIRKSVTNCASRLNKSPASTSLTAVKRRVGSFESQLGRTFVKNSSVLVVYKSCEHEQHMNKEPRKVSPRWEMFLNEVKTSDKADSQQKVLVCLLAAETSEKRLMTIISLFLIAS